MPVSRYLINKLTSPNAITALRVFIAPYLLFLSSTSLQDSFIVRSFSASLFVLIAMTDLLDGYLARKQKRTSKFGACFDHIADKILIVSVLLPLMKCSKAPIVPVSIIILREIIVSGLREFIATQYRISIPTTFLSKTKTFVHMATIPFLLLSKTGSGLLTFSQSLLWVGAILSCITLYFHVKAAMQCIKAKADNNKL